MTKRELINKLESLPIPDDAPVEIMDWKKNARNDCGDGSSEGCYSEFEVCEMNTDLTPDEIEFFIDRHEVEPKLFIALTFDNPDIEDL